MSRPTMTEAAFQELVIETADTLGWAHMHVHKSRRTDGSHVTATNVPWPDLTLWHPTAGGVLLRELKVRDVWQPGQKDVLASLAAAGADADVWWPHDYDSGRVVAELTRRRR